MNKQELFKKYNDEDKLLLSKILDKVKYTKEKNKISNTDFLNSYEQKIVMELLQRIREENYFLEGGFSESERKIIFFYPEKLSSIFRSEMLKVEDIINVIRIELPNEMHGKYIHKNYLSGLMKLGIKREKIGDIIVDTTGADIFVKSDICEYVTQELKGLKRFSKSKIYNIELNEVREQNIQKEEIRIIVPSLRLDSVVSELANASRNKANEIILSERVLLNYTCETKNSKEIKIGDIITIRGKGRFTIKENLGKSKKDKIIILVEKFK